MCVRVFAFSTILVIIFSCATSADGFDAELRQLITDHGLQPIAQSPSSNTPLANLGKSLFFDRELSGNRNVSCATCHHPSASSGDSRALPSGVGGVGLGPDRTQELDREVVPRNAPEIFHRGNSEWTNLFWDSRVAKENEKFKTPAGAQLPIGFEHVLQPQAMFPVTSRAEMRGNDGDLDVNGQVNEIAQIADGDFQGIWAALTNRLMSIPAYKQAFQEAFPEVPEDKIGFQHAAKAIAEFEAAAFSPNDSAWDRYLAGDDTALSAAAKRGAVHFYDGNCASCHSGDLMTDQQHHNLAVPQFGPGKDPNQLDMGRALETGAAEDEFAFRTPPLRNVTLTGPWMHNGAFANLEDVVRHKYNPEDSLTNYDVNQLPEHLESTVKQEQALIDAMTSAIDPLLHNEELSTEKLNDLMAFMGALTSPSADLMAHSTPDSVFSGLDVERLPDSEIEMLYDPASGDLVLSGNAELELDAIFFRIMDDPGNVADFDFFTGVAPWADDLDIVLSDELDAQSFLDFRSDPKFLFAAGDTIESLLPAGLSEQAISDHLTAAYRVQGSPLLWTTSVTSVPEPSMHAIILAAACTLLLVRRRLDTTA